MNESPVNCIYLRKMQKASPHINGLDRHSTTKVLTRIFFPSPLLIQTCVLASFFFCKFAGMNVYMRGRLDKRGQIWSNSRQSEKADNREMVVLPRETYLEMKESLKILSQRK